MSLSREGFIERVNAGYAALRVDPEAWAEVERERRSMAGCLMHGLDPNERWGESRVPLPFESRTSLKMLTMLPPFDDVGNLPPGIHPCSVVELIARFGIGSEEREAEISELVQFIEAAQKAGVRRLLVNGSFVTGKLAPNDVDVVFLPGPDYPRRGPRLDDEELVWPFLQIIVAADDADFEAWATRQFATDRKKRRKGVVEVIL